jgi:transcriptional regulator with XRE-family HTH domain
MYSSYNFAIVRSLRRRLHMTLEELAKRSGLTYPTVSAIETNKTLPSMKTLDAIAGALEISASNLLALAEKRVVQIRKAESPKTEIRNQKGLDKCRVAFFDKGKMFRVQADQGEEVHVMELHEDCHEMCYVISGAVMLSVDGNDYPLYSDDTILFDGVLDHTYRMIEKGEFITVHIPKDIRIIESLLQNPGEEKTLEP